MFFYEEDESEYARNAKRGAMVSIYNPLRLNGDAKGPADLRHPSYSMKKKTTHGSEVPHLFRSQSDSLRRLAGDKIVHKTLSLAIFLPHIGTLESTFWRLSVLVSVELSALECLYIHHVYGW
jgi:hypothetical protein